MLAWSHTSFYNKFVAKPDSHVRAPPGGGWKWSNYVMGVRLKQAKNAITVVMLHPQ